MGKRLGSSLGVDWHMPLKGGGFAKRRFATTTVATAELVNLLAQDGLTVQEAKDSILWDHDAIAVLEAMVKKGFGDAELKNFVANWNS